MDFLDPILAPIMWVVAWIMVLAHRVFVFFGMNSSGWSWILSIVVLVIVMRILLIPLFVRQIKASRGLQIVQPEIQKLQKKYKGKNDPASRQAMQQEMMAIYREAGTNPFASCLPILAQSPIFFALFRVLYQLPNIADGTRGAIGPLDATLAAEAEASTLFGAPLSSYFMMPDATVQVRVVTVILIAAMSATMFTTQRQLTMKNMPQSALDNPMARQQRMLMYLMPLIFAFTGVNFPIGVLIYWTTTNLWTMGQQFYVIRNMPAPGSEAEKAYQARQERKAKRRAERKGLPWPPEPGQEGSDVLEDEQPRGQRQQPKRNQSRAKRRPAGQRPAGTESASADASSEADDVAAADADAATEGAASTSASARKPSQGSGGGGKKRSGGSRTSGSGGSNRQGGSAARQSGSRGSKSGSAGGSRGGSSGQGQRRKSPGSGGNKGRGGGTSQGGSSTS